MKSNVIKKDREELVKICKAMSPQERLMAFYDHSRLMVELSQSRKKSSRRLPKNTSS